MVEQEAEIQGIVKDEDGGGGKGEGEGERDE